MFTESFRSIAAVLFIVVIIHLGCANGALRLAGSGSSSTQGRVEICYSNRWGTVCDDYWGTSNAKVACRQLGYSINGKKHCNQCLGKKCFTH